MNIEKQLPGIQKNISLKDYTTFKIGGLAKYFFVAKTKEDIIKVISVAEKFKLPFFILGGGSNILVSDRGYNGLIIKTQNVKLKIKNYPKGEPSVPYGAGNSKFKFFCEVGVPLAKLVSESLQIWATGLEWAIGIPGTIGGAIYGNAGAFGKSIGDIVEIIEVYDLKNNKIKFFRKRDCQFTYRESVFKKNRNLVILSVTFQLTKGNRVKIKKRIKEYLNYRKENQPLNFPSAGSIFKNPAPKQSLVRGRSTSFSAGELGKEDKSSSSRLAAARLIEECDLKGKMIGKAKISEKHANFIINLGGAKAEDVKKLIKLIKEKVKKNFGIFLEEEISYLGFKN